MKKEDKLKIVLACFGVICICFGALIGILIGRAHKTIIVYKDFIPEEITEEKSQRYPFLNKTLSDYIENLSAELKINPNLVVAILLQENPEFDPMAENKNSNGTMDVGLFQLNSRYMYRDFERKYFPSDVEFNPYNWKHNTFIALHLIQDLTENLKVMDDVIMAYNCGINAVLNNDIPVSTYQYLAAVKNNYILLENENGNN